MISSSKFFQKSFFNQLEEEKIKLTIQPRDSDQVAPWELHRFSQVKVQRYNSHHYSTKNKNSEIPDSNLLGKIQQKAAFKKFSIQNKYNSSNSYSSIQIKEKQRNPSIRSSKPLKQSRFKPISLPSLQNSCLNNSEQKKKLSRESPQQFKFSFKAKKNDKKFPQMNIKQYLQMKTFKDNGRENLQFMVGRAYKKKFVKGQLQPYSQSSSMNKYKIIIQQANRRQAQQQHQLNMRLIADASQYKQYINQSNSYIKKRAVPPNISTLQPLKGY